MNLALARRIRALEVDRRNRLEAQFQTYRPTPTRAECDAGGVTLVKVWDLSEIDALSFAPTEPPGRPDDGRPVSTGLPLVSGLARVGDMLNATPGTWTNAPTGFTYQWRRGPYDIAGATAATYVPTTVDLRWPLNVRVVASNAIGPAAAISLPTAPVLPYAPICAIVPVVTGLPEVGELLIASVGGWDNAATAYQYEWRRDLEAIVGEIGAAYTPTLADEGFTLRVGVRGVNAGGVGSVTYSTAIGPIGGAAAPGAPPVNLALPTVTGTTTVGQSLVSSVGAWANAPSAYARQWLRDGANIAGASAISYLLVAADLGAMIAIEVTASNALGSATATSLEVGPVDDLPVQGQPPVNATPPSLSGNRQVGQMLTCDDGTWTGAPTSFEYEWRRGAQIIAGANGQTYTLAPLDQGWSIYCRVVAINVDGMSTPMQTQMVGPVIAAGLPYCTTLPVVTGDPRSGETLTVADGTWTGAPTAFAYAWLRNGLLVSEYEATFELSDTEIASTIACRVTAINAAGSASFDSLPVGPVVPENAP